MRMRAAGEPEYYTALRHSIDAETLTWLCAASEGGEDEEGAEGCQDTQFARHCSSSAVGLIAVLCASVCEVVGEAPDWWRCECDCSRVCPFLK